MKVIQYIYVLCKNIIYKLINYLLIFCILVIVTKNIFRIIKIDNNYNNYPWPKYYSMNNKNYLTKFKVNKFDKIHVTTPINGYCMYSKKICAHYELEKNIKHKKIKNYDLFYFCSFVHLIIYLNC